MDELPEDTPSDRVIEVTNVSVHSLQDDYQLSVKFIRCRRWLDGATAYVAGRPDDNEPVRRVRDADDKTERDEAVDRLMEPFRDSFALIEFVAGCQMEYKNGPVVVVDKLVKRIIVSYFRTEAFVSSTHLNLVGLLRNNNL